MPTLRSEALESVGETSVFQILFDSVVQLLTDTHRVVGVAEGILLRHRDALGLCRWYRVQHAGAERLGGLESGPKSAVELGNQNAPFAERRTATLQPLVPVRGCFTFFCNQSRATHVLWIAHISQHLLGPVCRGLGVLRASQKSETPAVIFSVIRIWAHTKQARYAELG